ncbi:MAG: ABC transporter ATP-binding protein [Actinobacteria bacterium]|nr:ABC transporter ATP-binding protein [Actinomycetota bacterium]
MSFIVEVENISKKYGNITAVDNISFKIKEGEFFSLLGPSGCGKTTILRIIGGLAEQDSGNVIIDGADMKERPPNRRDTSLVFQNLALFPHMNVEENITYGLRKRKIPAVKIKEKMTNMLSVVNLSGFEKRRITELSGGQQQRVALARSLIIEPKILLLDEPLASLDKKLRISMRMELKEIQRRTGTTFLYVTHDQSEALTMSDSIAVMNEGKIIQTGSPDFIYNKPSNSFIADFIGAGNFIQVSSISRKDTSLRLKTLGENEIILENKDNDYSLLNEKTYNLTPAHPNQYVFFIRPEKIKIDLSPRKEIKNVNYFSGIILSKIFEGPDIRLLVFSEKIGDITIEVKNDQIYKNFIENSPIFFYWNYSDGVLLVK